LTQTTETTAKDLAHLLHTRDMGMVAAVADRLVSERVLLDDEELHDVHAGALSARSSEFRRRLARNYIRLLGPEAGPRAALQLVQESSAPEVRSQVVDALVELGPPGLPALAELSRHRDTQVRWHAVRALRRIGGEDAIQPLINRLADPDFGTRWAAGSGLVEIGRPAIEPLLHALVMRPPDRLLHGAALRVIRAVPLPGVEMERKALIDSLRGEAGIYSAGWYALDLLVGMMSERVPGVRRLTRADRVGDTGRTETLPVHVRQGAHADQDAIQDLWESTGLTRGTAKEWRALMEDRTTSVLVAEDDERHLVGAAVAAFDGWRAYIYHVAVAPSYRGQGVARTLMREAEAHLAAAGAQHVYVMVSGVDTAGLALVVGSGYMPEGEIVLAKPLAGAVTA
jgi:ribosomal protein S18 acetylase RimI-like enzyme